jgi:predicted nucleotidyltransferase
MHSVEDQIDQLLTRLESQHGFRIVYACESGSRAWGFASPDSDYDIRFLFVRPERFYLSVIPGTEAIDLPLEGELDAGGWDIRKAAGLLGKSNGALVEWLHSPIVYRAAPGFLDRWRSAAVDVFSPKASADHYRGLAKQMLHVKLSSPQVRAKDYLYALRSTLAARWVLDGRGIPPVPFAELLPMADDAIRALVPDLLKHKEATAECERMDRIPVLDDFLRAAMETTEQHLSEIPPPKIRVDAVDLLLRREVRAGNIESVDAFTLDRIRKPDVLLFDAVAGSHAYGTNIASSDQDRRGVFVMPDSILAGLDSIEQVSDERSDQVYYELGRFVELLLRNNPNALEMIAMPDDCVLFRHRLFEMLSPSIFLSKLCEKTFGEYAMGQIRKARGLNKKIVNPQPEKRHPMLAFCHVPEGQGSVPLLDWLATKGIDPEHCGVTAVRNAADLFAIYQNDEGGYRGLVSNKDPDALVFSSVPKEALPVCWMHFNEDAFKAHCKAHREYWLWVEERNEERYATNASHGRGYDSKNLMHTIRLLEMAGEIAREGVLKIRRPNRDFLLKIRSGEFEYEELVTRAEQLHADLGPAYAASDLPETPDRDRVNQLLVEIRKEFLIG